MPIALPAVLAFVRSWRGAAIIAGVVLLIGLTWWVVGTREAVVTQRVEASIGAASAAATVRTRVADEAADVRREDDGARVRAERKGLDDAVVAMPDRALSVRQRARLECVRRQQDSRKLGMPAPACR